MQFGPFANDRNIGNNLISPSAPRYAATVIGLLVCHVILLPQGLQTVRPKPNRQALAGLGVVEPDLIVLIPIRLREIAEVGPMSERVVN